MRKVRKPYDLLMVTFALLFNPSTTPLENSLRALKWFSSSARWVRSVRAIFFMGSMRLRMVWRHQKSRNMPDRVGELYFQNCWKSSLSR